MTSQHTVTSLCNLIFSCLNRFAESHGSNHRHQDSASPGVSELPTSVILEIFFKLPINTLLRCKCVCKSWRNLISDPYFVDSYCKNPPFTAIVRSEHRAITNRLDDGSFEILEIGRNGDVVRTPFFANVFDVPRNGFISIYGSCNGLLCLVKGPHLVNENDGNYVGNRDSMYNDQTVCVVNPLTGERVLLPDVISAEYIRDVIYGFGSSASHNLYKVIRLVARYVFVGVGHEIEAFGEIFTLGVDKKWRRFDDFSIPYYVFPCGIALNGFVHWIGDNRQFGVIYAFDIAEEKGHCIPLPPGLGDAPGNVILTVWNDCLCLTDNGSEIQVDVWVMKQYGVAKSWTRDFILRRWIPSDLRSYRLNPITTSRNGDLLLSRQCSQRLISFDPRMRSCGKLDIADVEGTVSFLFGFTPSFTSLSNVYSRRNFTK